VSAESEFLFDLVDSFRGEAARISLDGREGALLVMVFLEGEVEACFVEGDALGQEPGFGVLVGQGQAGEEQVAQLLEPGGGEVGVLLGGLGEEFLGIEVIVGLLLTESVLDQEAGESRLGGLDVVGVEPLNGFAEGMVAECWKLPSGPMEVRDLSGERRSGRLVDN
jgi:hypothetical protein